MKDENNRYSYMYGWQKEKMSAITVRYKKEFVQEFKEACKSLNKSQSEIIKQAMIQTIEEANKNSRG